MEIFFVLLVKLLPLYFYIVLGFVANKVLKVDRESIANLLIYIIAPAVVLYGVLKAEIQLSVLILPLFFFVLCCLFASVLYVLSGLFWKDSTRNIFSYMSASGNTGYFGLPVAIAIFNNGILSLMVFAILGFIFFESTFGYYILARGNFTPRESFMKLLKLPAMYAAVTGLILNFSHFALNDTAVTFFEQFKGAYTLLGMMIIGMGLATVKLKSFDLKFIGSSFVVRFLVWPLVMLGLVFVDRTYLHVFNEEIYKVMLLLSIVPLPANAVALGTQLKVHPEKAAAAVFLSTLFALVFIPVMVGIWFR